ncbi:MAG: hypothetical protein ABIP13_01855 [Tepidiformaceae bacterium]
MNFEPSHLNPIQEPTHAMRHREEYLIEKKAKSRKAPKLPMVPLVDVKLLRAEVTATLGRFLRIA